MMIKDRLKILIDLLGLNLKEFSRKTGIPYPTLLQYLSGKREPIPENLQKIAIHLNVNLNWLLIGEGEPFVKKEPVEMDDITQKILIMLKDMDEEKKKDILAYIEKEKLLMELLEERKKKQAG